jgi:hypothetical protein
MSWSINFIGKPENVVKAIKAYGEKLSGASKDEFDSSSPKIIDLVEENMNKNGEVLIKVVANGHAHFTENEKQYGYLNITIEPIVGNIV